jgi:MYXO-CTERM domain-containing protein
LVCEADVCVPSGSGEAGDDGPTTSNAGTESGDAGIDYLEAENCSVGDSEHRPGPLALALLGLFGLGLRRRRLRTQ